MWEQATTAGGSKSLTYEVVFCTFGGRNWGARLMISKIFGSLSLSLGYSYKLVSYEKTIAQLNDYWGYEINP